MRRMYSVKQIQEMVSGGTNVVANPTLAGTEDALTGLQVGETKYSVPQTHAYRIECGNANFTKRIT